MSCRTNFNEACFLKLEQGTVSVFFFVPTWLVKLYSYAFCIVTDLVPLRSSVNISSHFIYFII